MDMATQICSALKFLENKGITHGDLVIISVMYLKEGISHTSISEP